MFGSSFVSLALQLGMPGGWVSEVKCGVEDGSPVNLWLGSECLSPREGLREKTAINGPKEVEIDACN